MEVLNSRSTYEGAKDMPSVAIEEFKAPGASRDRFRVDGRFLARGSDRFRVQGVTYGPFAPNENDEPFPEPHRVRDDFSRMRELGVNSIRTYYMPPAWLLSLADAAEIAVLADVPWSKHVCFLSNDTTRREARQRIHAAVRRGREHPCVLAYSIGNEIPSNIVRWQGPRKVEQFLAELMDVARQADPECLVTYANYPSTEYLDLSGLDFTTFNVYLHEPEAFRRYMFRLQHLAGDRPLVLGEIGMDTLRHSQDEQAEFLGGHLREAKLMGVAGAFVFAWTDDWFTGGHQIEDWAFGITRSDRSVKPACNAVASVFRRSPSELLHQTPRVSVVVCSYNGGTTLAQCLRSLEALDYPDYEIILVDDGSTDDTRAITARFPAVRALHQTNQGLSVARNAGLHAATGSIIAYTDSDCFADPDWLTHLVHQLERSGAAAVGGPNLSPEDGWRAACVAASPGQPTHVLENDQTAEHIPGCNMAYRREALLAINGFNPKYRQAGDDVDLCWRLEQAGMWITFAPGAFVWHHRRQTPRAYLRQQAGYGKAEALLWFDHPDRFNGQGASKWRGTMYGASLQGLHLGTPIIYSGTFGTGLFQTLYQPGPAHWAMLPSTLEWHLVAIMVLAAASVWPAALLVVATMFSLSIGIATLQASRAALAARYHGVRSRILVACLCYLQPLTRSWARYRTRLFPPKIQAADPEVTLQCRHRLPLTGRLTIGYWGEAWQERTDLLDRAAAYFTGHRWAFKVDSGWSHWDIAIQCHPWTALHIVTAQEDHGGGRRLMRIRYRLQSTEYAKAVMAIAVADSAFALHFRAVPIAMVSAVLIAFYLAAWRRGTRLASEATGIVDALAREICLTPVVKDRTRRRAPQDEADCDER